MAGLIFHRRELPPTAGLPIHFRDYLLPPRQSLAEGLSGLCGLPSPALTCSGTAALVIALQAARESGPGKNRVIIPAYSCPLVPLAVQLVPGLRAEVCDVLPGSIDLDPERLDTLCSPDTLAIVPTHLGGRLADVATASEIARKHGAMVIEDAAQALGARYRGQSAGMAGDIGFFSLAAGKGLTTYEGGVLFSRHEQLHQRLKELARQRLPGNLAWTARRNLQLFGYLLFYRPSMLWQVYGRNLDRQLERGDPEAAVGDRFSLEDIPLHRLDPLRQRVAANALPRLAGYLEAARIRASIRRTRLSALGLRVLDDPPGADGVWPFFMVLMPGKEQRDAALARLWRAGLGISRLFIRALPDYPYLSGLFPQADIPGARDLADRMLTISNSHWLTDSDFERILADLRASL